MSKEEAYRFYVMSYYDLESTRIFLGFKSIESTAKFLGLISKK